MPRRTGTRTAAQNASTESGAAASRLVLQSSPRRVALLRNKNGPPAGRPKWVASDRTQLQAELTSIGGIHDDRGHGQGDRDHGGNGKQRGPHGIASSLARRARGSLARATRSAGFGSWGPHPGCGFLVTNPHAKIVRL